MTPAATASDASKGPWHVEFNALAKAAGGAVLFGTPLLFTMEMWWVGESQPRLHLLGFLALAFLLNVALARMSGFRGESSTLPVAIGQALEAMAIGVAISAAILLALGRIDTDTSLAALLGTVAIQVIPLSLGATVGNLVFDPDVGRANDGDSKARSPLGELVNDLGATVAGALFLGFTIAPTEEIPMLAADLDLVQVLAVIALTLVASYLIVFASGFDPTHRGGRAGGFFQKPFSETMLCYVVSLGVACAMLYGFGQVGGGDTLHAILIKTIVLGVPAAIGGAAGRVVV